MIRVNNKKTIHKLTVTTFKANKMRNTFGVLAIVLTTILFTVLFTCVKGIYTAIEESVMLQSSDRGHATYWSLTEEEYQRLKEHDSIKAISSYVELSYAENEELVRRQTTLAVPRDSVIAEMKTSMPTVGRLPEAKNEIATDTLVLELLGVPAELGSQVTLEYSMWNGTQVELRKETFTLVGFWKGSKIDFDSTAWVSPAFMEESLEKYDSSLERYHTVEVQFDNIFSLEEKMVKVLEESGISTQEVRCAPTMVTNLSEPMDGGLVAIPCIILLVMLCGYLFISNVFSAGIAKDVQYYGLLKTIGTTPKQIKGLVRRQALWLCIIGIPLGAFAGYFAGVMISEQILATLNIAGGIVISNNLWVYLATALFSVITVFVSVSKPARMAARVSPIEALRVSDGSQTLKNTSTKSGKAKVWRMAVSNFTRNKSKTGCIIASLILSLILLNMSYSTTISFKRDYYLEQILINDFVLGDYSYFNPSFFYNPLCDTLNEDLLQAVEAQEGVKNVNSVYYLDSWTLADDAIKAYPDKIVNTLEIDPAYVEQMKIAVDNGIIITCIYGLEGMLWDEFTVYEGEIDREKLATGKYVVISPYDHEGKVSCYEVGDKVKLGDTMGSSLEEAEFKEYEVLAIAEWNAPYSTGETSFAEIVLYMPAEEFLEGICKLSPMVTAIDVEEEYKGDIEAFLKNYSEEINPDLVYYNRELMADEFQAKNLNLVNVVGEFMSVVLAAIGLFNFANITVTSIFARKREFALLQSIGMTNRQVAGMLIGEGFLYVIATVLLTLTIGSIIGYKLLDLLLWESPYLEMKYSALPTLICIPLMLALTGGLPYSCMKVLGRNSVVERLRECE